VIAHQSLSCEFRRENRIEGREGRKRGKEEREERQGRKRGKKEREERKGRKRGKKVETNRYNLEVFEVDLEICIVVVVVPIFDAVDAIFDTEEHGLGLEIGEICQFNIEVEIAQ
jgi:hypothetical protein